MHVRETVCKIDISSYMALLHGQNLPQCDIRYFFYVDCTIYTRLFSFKMEWGGIILFSKLSKFSSYLEAVSSWMVEETGVPEEKI